MTALGPILRALGRGRHAGAPDGAAADLSGKARQDALKLIARAGRHLRLLDRQLECGLLIRRERASEAARLDELAGLLDLEHATAHVREAIARAPHLVSPVPHIVVPNLWPDAVLAAARGAVPAAAFFDVVHEGYEAMAAPLSFAPVVSMATWTFVTTLTRQALLDALVETFRGSLDQPALVARAPRRRKDFTVLHARLVRWHAGGRRAVDGHPLPGVVAIVNVGESAHRLDVRAGSGEATDIVLPPGAALACLVVAGQEASVVGSAPDSPGCTYEVAIGPHRAVQRALAAPAR